MDLGKRLYEDISEHNYPAAKLLILRGADTNYRGSEGTPLMLAIFYGDDVELIQLLVNHGADVRAKMDIDEMARGFTPLHYHISLHRLAVNFPAIATILLDAGANINAKDAEGNTPLHIAAKKGYASKVQYLLSRGANPAIKNNQGQLPVDLVPEPNQALRRLLLTAIHRSHYKK